MVFIRNEYEIKVRRILNQRYSKKYNLKTEYFGSDGASYLFIMCILRFLMSVCVLSKCIIFLRH